MEAAGEDWKQRTQTNRERGWFDKSIFMYDNSTSWYWRTFAWDLCHKYCPVNWTPNDEYFWSDYEGYEPEFTGWTKSANDKVVRLQSPTAPWARNPVHSILDAVIQSSDGIIIFTAYEPNHQVEFIERCIQGMDYKIQRLSVLNKASLEPKPPAFKKRALTIVFSVDMDDYYQTYNSSAKEMVEARFAKWEVFCRERGYLLYKFQHSKDPVKREEFCKKVLEATLDEIEHNRGIEVETKFYPRDVLNLQFKELLLSNPEYQQKKKRERNSLWGKFKRAVWLA